MNEQIEATVKLTNEKIQFTGSSRDNREVIMDYFPPLGDGKGYTGLELLLVSFGGCSSTSIVYLLRKMGKSINGFKVNLRGIRKDKPPLSFSQIYMEFIVNSDDVIDSDMQRAIKLSEDSVCPVWDMIKNNVEIITNYKIEVGVEAAN
jgi:putative redox protein